MNTFFNIYQEFSIDFCIRLRDRGMGMERFDERNKNIAAIKRLPLHRRITLRGNNEQYLNKFAIDYYGSKRLSRSHVFTANTI